MFICVYVCVDIYPCSMLQDKDEGSSSSTNHQPHQPEDQSWFERNDHVTLNKPGAKRAGKKNKETGNDQTLSVSPLDDRYTGCSKLVRS